MAKSKKSPNKNKNGEIRREQISPRINKVYLTMYRFKLENSKDEGKGKAIYRIDKGSRPICDLVTTQREAEKVFDQLVEYNLKQEEDYKYIKRIKQGDNDEIEKIKWWKDTEFLNLLSFMMIGIIPLLPLLFNWLSENIIFKESTAIFAFLNFILIWIISAVVFLTRIFLVISNEKLQWLHQSAKVKKIVTSRNEKELISLNFMEKNERDTLMQSTLSLYTIIGVFSASYEVSFSPYLMGLLLILSVFTGIRY